MSTVYPTEIRKLTVDPMMQSRGHTDAERVAEYAQALMEGATFPPVRAMWDRETLWLWDGFHRYQAHLDAGIDMIDVDTDSGTKRDAWIKSLGANAHHGLNLSNDEKRHNVERALADPELAEMADRTLAKICNVSHTFVANMRPKTGEEATAKARPDERPSKAKVTKPEKPAPGNVATSDAGEEVSKVVELEERNAILVAEHERMVDRLAVVAMEGTEEEKAVASQTIEELRKTLTVRDAEVAVLKDSRDSYMREATELKKALGALQRKIDRMEGGKAPAKKT